MADMLKSIGKTILEACESINSKTKSDHVKNKIDEIKAAIAELNTFSDQQSRAKPADHERLPAPAHQMDKKVLESLQRIEDAQKKNTKTILQHIAKNVYLPDTHKPTYASMVTKTHSLMVTSTDSQTSGENIKDKLTKAVDARALGIAVDTIRTRKTAVIISCPTTEDREKVKKAVASTNPQLIMKDDILKKPTIVLKGVLKDITEDELQESVRKQNKFPDSVIKIKYKRRNRHPLLANVICEVSSDLYRSIMESGRVNIGHQRVYADDVSPVIQCYNCMGFGHTKRFCELTKPACSHCAGNHTFKDCPKLNNQATCCNCSSKKRPHTDHAATSFNCPIKALMDRRARERIDYGTPDRS